MSMGKQLLIIFRTSLNHLLAVSIIYDIVIDVAGGLQREDLADLELAKKKQNVLLKQLLAMPGRDPMLGLECALLCFIFTVMLFFLWKLLKSAFLCFIF